MNKTNQAVVDSVKTILDDTNLNTMIDDVMDRLVSFGCTPSDNDVWLIPFHIQRTVDRVLNEINHKTIPDGLHTVVMDMICGEVLQAKFLSGQLNLIDMDLNGMVQSVKMGDTQVNFSADGSDESKAQELFRWLIHGREGELMCYRKMRW